MPKRWPLVLLFFALLALVAACAVAPAERPQAPTSPLAQLGEESTEDGPRESALTVYSGRNEKLIAPLIARFQEETGVQVRVRYGDTAELAAAILEEGVHTPADVYLAQDAGGLGALAAAQRLRALPDAILQRVDARFRDPQGRWVGISGRARVVVYNTTMVQPEDLPDSILGFTDPKWRGNIGWAPTNGSFQSFVTALRLVEGEETALRWLQGIQANQPKIYQNNTAIVQAVGAGEIAVGFANHYYLFRFIAEQGESFPVRNYFPRAGDPGAMMNVAGAGILNTSARVAEAEQFVAYMLSEAAQRYFADETFEYPLVDGVATHPLLAPLADLRLPMIDLGSLADLERTLQMLQDAGVF